MDEDQDVFAFGGHRILQVGKETLFVERSDLSQYDMFVQLLLELKSKTSAAIRVRLVYVQVESILRRCEFNLVTIAAVILHRGAQSIAGILQAA